MQYVLMFLMALTIALNLVSVYLGVTAMFLFKRRKPYAAAEPVTRYAVIIPARNEEQVVGNLIECLRRQDYPQEKIDIYVAANNCTDHTTEVAQAAGAKVISCTGEITCKGDVLHQAVEVLLPMEYDAFAVFDADNLPHTDFLQRMNDALVAGERVCKGRIVAGNAYESWVAGSYGLYNVALEWSYSRPHAAMGCSSNLVGNAFVVHRSVLEQMDGWNTSTMCEDSEFAAKCAVIGVRVAWVAEAITLDEQPNSFLVSLRQRRRWCSGVVEAGRQELKNLLRADCPNRKLAIDTAMLYIIAHTQPLAILVMLISLFFQPLNMLLLGVGGLVLSYIGLMLVAVLTIVLGQYTPNGILKGYTRKATWLTITLFPIFMASWIPLQIMAVLKPVRKWHAIHHKGQG